MVNLPRLELSELIQHYYPEIKSPDDLVEYILQEIQNKITSDNCPTCDESDEDEIIKSPKKKYPASLWTCPACNVATTMKNKPNHERTDKHKKLLKEFQDVYRIAKVLKMRNLRGVEQALIKWSGYSEKHNTWIPAAHLYMDSSCTFGKIGLKE